MLRFYISSLMFFFFSKAENSVLFQFKYPERYNTIMSPFDKNIFNLAKEYNAPKKQFSYLHRNRWQR